MCVKNCANDLKKKKPVSLILGYQPAADSLPVQPNQEPSATEEQNNFSPGPYIIGSLVPRCFDTSRRVQSTALACLQILVSSIFKAVPKSRDPKILPIGMKIMRYINNIRQIQITFYSLY